MLNRYPHNAVIVTQKTVTDANGMTGNDPETDCEIEVEGRYERKSSFNGDYTGKFYMAFMEVCNFAGDWQKLKHNNREFEIVHFSNHKTHTVLWLK